MCRTLYASEDVKLVAEQSRVKLYHSTCSSCAHGLFYYMVEAGGGVSAVGLITDASASDAPKLISAPALSSEDCISVHRMISDKSRDLCRNLLDISGKLA
jgi:hypothetical protein